MDRYTLVLIILIQQAAPSLVGPLLKLHGNKGEDVSEIIHIPAFEGQAKVNDEPKLLTWADRLPTSESETGSHRTIYNWVEMDHGGVNTEALMTVSHHPRDSLLKLHNLSNKHLQVQMINTVKESSFWLLSQETKHIFNLCFKKDEMKTISVTNSGSWHAKNRQRELTQDDLLLEFSIWIHQNEPEDKPRDA